MFTLTTATGKKLESDYATTMRNPPLGFFTVRNKDLETVKSIFANQHELPLEGYPEFNTVSEINDKGYAIELVLEP